MVGNQCGPKILGLELASDSLGSGDQVRPRQRQVGYYGGHAVVVMDEKKSHWIEDEIIKLLADEIAKEQDASMLYELYKNIGWYEVKPRDWHDRDRAAEIWQWCRDHLASEYYSSSGLGYLFAQESDAMMFTLRWL
jgi:hypothetical protein